MAWNSCVAGAISGLDKYREFVKCNPLFASEIESSLRWMSYFTAGCFDKSSVVSELLYSSSSLLTLFNDFILRSAAHMPLHLNVAVERIQTYLSILEYVEVFAELAAGQMGGEATRWSIILAIQFIKTAFRLLLLFKHNQGIQKSPPISPLNRRRDIPRINTSKEGTSANGVPSVEITFKLKQSGRTIRTLAAAPPMSKRTWKVPVMETETTEGSNAPRINYPPTPLEREKLTAELLHILRPVIHLIAMSSFGKSSWKPFLLALGTDMTSLQLFGDRRKVNHEERLELNRRALILLLYFLRSPFYDKFTKIRIISLLRFLSDNLPIIGLFLRPVLSYLPEWQRTYFYTWSL